MIKEMITIQTEHAELMKKWSDKWVKFFQQDEYSFAAYQSTIHLLVTASSVGNDIAEQINQSIEELEKLWKLAPKSDSFQSLHIERQQAHSNINKTKGKLAILEKKKSELQNGLNLMDDALKETSFKVSKRSELLAHKRTVQKQGGKVKQDIQIKKEEHQQGNEINSYESSTIFQRNQEREFERLRSIQDLIMAFILALRIKSAPIVRAMQDHDPSKDLRLWRRKYYSEPVRLNIVNIVPFYWISFIV
jgi:septal ring factor EnvC (AmiA/AmiB activator)